MEKEVLVKVEGVSKKFARDLKKSLRYGLQDIRRELFGKSRKIELRKSEFWAVDNISFELNRGECLGLIGHNGAGKSTLLKILNGLIKPDKGRVEMRGRVAALIELGAGFNPILTGRENIYNNASVLGFTKEETEAKLDEIIAFSELEEFIDAPVQSYSSGMKVRLGFAVAAQMEPDVLIIDEVLAVGDVGFKIKCFNRIAELLEKCAVIFVSHSMPQVSRICDRGIYMVKGKQHVEGTNLEKAVKAYYDSFNYALKTYKVEDKKVILSDLVVTNQKGESVLNYLDDLHISFKFENITNDSLDTFSIVLQDKDYKSIANSMVSVAANNGEIEVVLPRLQLGTGHYILNLKFFSSIGTDIRGVIIDSYENISTFQVVNSPIISGASFQLENKIRLK